MNRRSFLGAALAAGAVTPALPGHRLAAEQADFSSSTATAADSAPSTSMQVASSVQMCVFDTFGTVCDWRGSVINEVDQLAPPEGLGSRRRSLR